MKEKLYNLYITKEMSISEVAKELGVSSSTVYRRLKKWDIPRRKNGAHQKGVPMSEKTKKKLSEANKGKKLSKETRKKISEALKGSKNPNYGKSLSKEIREKLSEALKGRRGHKHSKESRKKISEALKGKKLTEEHKRRLSEAKKGSKNYNYGKSPSKEARRKMSEAKRGAKAPNWRGGVTPKNKEIRNGIEYKLWREAVFARDNWTCQKTGVKGGELNAHHIQDFSTYPELRTSIENGITLSKKAHKGFHRKYGFKNNTKEQLEEYLS